MSAHFPRAILALILLLYILLASLFAARTPAWQAPDEPAHYNYVRYLADNAAFPVLHMGDYPHAYLAQIKDARFPAGMSIEPIRYEFHQPPLYYALAAPVYTLSGGSLIALRLVSVLFGAGIVVLAYAIGRRALPHRPALALGAAAFVAFLPQHLATVSQVGNDALAELLYAVTLYVAVGWVKQAEEDRGNRPSPRPPARLPFSVSSPLSMGVLLGLILITKTTAFIALPVAAAALIWRWIRGRASARRVVMEALAVIVPAALIALPWFARNIWVYGWPDFLGLQRHDAIVVGQTRTAEFIAQNGWAAYWRRAIEWTFKSFWGVFGWMGVWLDTRVYFAVALLSGLALGGAGLRVTCCRAVSSTRHIAGLLALSALCSGLAYAWYNLTFLQHQGRYLFTALIPIALAFAWGWDAALQPKNSRLLAAGFVLFGFGLAVWGALSGVGLAKWPLAITVAFAGALIVVSYIVPRLSTICRPRSVLFVLSLASLVLLDLYALFGAIVPQLTR